MSVAKHISHRDFVVSLTNSQRKFLTRKTDVHGIGRLIIHWIGITVFAVVVVQDGLVGYISMLPLGVLLVFLFAPLHETVHKTPFKTAWINTAVGFVCGLILILPYHWFKYFHFEHHRHTQMPGLDPELIRPKPDSPGSLFLYLSGLPLYSSLIRVLVRNAMGKQQGSFVPENKREVIRRESQVMLVIYVGVLVASIYFKSTIMLYLWVIPVLLGQPFLRMFLLAEHGLCPNVQDMFANSRTTSTNFLMRTLCWNMSYHAEHHAYPAVPFHQLPAFHILCRDSVQITSKGYLIFAREYFNAVRQS